LSFERLIAGRYLRAHRLPRALNYLRWATFGLLLTTAAVFIGHRLVDQHLSQHLSQFMWDLRSGLRAAKFITVLATVLIGLLVELVRRLTIVSTISTFSLFLGTGVLVTALSVMSGFEQDLKGKILGTHAHMVVSTPDRSFTDYREALAEVEKVPSVLAATPSLSGEVMLTSQSNVSGVMLKGIDPGSVGRVTDLVRNTDQGSLDNLLHPENIQGLEALPPPSDAAKERAKSLAKDLAKNDALDLGADGAAGTVKALAKEPVKEPIKEPIKEPGKQPTQEPSAAPSKATAKEVPAPVNPSSGESAAAEKIGTEQAANPAPPPRPKRILPGVVIGRELAKNLRVYVGDEVHVVSPMGEIGPTGSIPKARPFRVAAIFFSGMYEYDSKYVYMLLPTAQKFLGVGDEVSEIELKLRTPNDTEPAMTAVQARLAAPGLGGGFYVQDWQHLNASLFTALKLEKIAMFIALCFIILVAASSIVSNGIMLVLEKGREIAILKSMGASNLSVLRIFLWHGLSMGVLGTLLGALAGYAVCWAFDRYGLPLDTDVYYITKLPVKVNPSELLAVVGAALALSLSATLYPAWLAARLRPVDGLR
jgi:lipoprotein-releasing system permease protein